ncbi:DHA2 family multidrug resistance protein [Nitrospirillum amazonense]|uniref:DHA2 family multidrug resistance protein n=1 Tax=Nitrospirillum amazonense TaxID=28077 RepID=A0A560EL37_9PROT|nr:MFS transporter [Nitrospirillum amazonense]TWB10091.1 DHA2 family multidrug resistance protein [Nitrospirillum amazonense]
MTGSVAQASAAAAPASPRGGPAPFSPRIAAGLAGVLIAVLVSGFNEHVTDIDMTDIRGALGIGHDEGTWLTALYEAFQVSAMAFAPWCAVTFSLRRFTIAMVGLFALLAAAAPVMPDLPSLYILRAIQGFAGGALPPMLMTVALRYLPPKGKIYGLGAYALTATCGPNLATPLAALCFEYFGWRAVFWEAIPLSIVSMLLVFYGLPQDPLRLERFRQFDWRGLLLGFPAICMLVIGLMQGDRLDWFRSPLICHLIVAGIFLFTMFLLNEWFQPLPFFRIQMLRSRDLSFSLIAVATVLVLAVANVDVPSTYLAEVRGYRPLQVAPMALVVAMPQLLALPLVSTLCNIRRVDCRWVLAGGLLLMGASAYGGSLVTSDWFRGNFYLLQAFQVFGQPMAIIPILMLATMKLAPTDGPFVSGMFNMVKGFANAIAAGLISFLETWREHTHSNVLLDHYGASRFMLSGLNAGPSDLATFAQSVRAQALVLTTADIDLVMIGIAAALFLLIPVLPTRVYPPASASIPTPAAR